MNRNEIKQALSAMPKNRLLGIIEELMADGIIDITDINLCHTRALEAKLSAKDKVIDEADTCIFRSVFTDSLGKPGNEDEMAAKLAWLDRAGKHNMDGILSYINERRNSKQENK